MLDLYLVTMERSSIFFGKIQFFFGQIYSILKITELSIVE